MGQSGLLQSFLNGTPPKNLRMIAAQGLVPIAPSEMLELLLHLAKDPEPEVATQAANSLRGWTEAEVVTHLRSPQCSPRVLDHFAETSTSAVIQEAVILNPSTDGKAIEALAARVPAPLMETILYNRVRLLETPGIIAGLKKNPSITTPIQVLLHEIESEFFASKRTEYVVGTEGKAAAEEPETLDVEAELSVADFVLEGLPTDPREREAVLQKRLAHMTVPQKRRLAHSGSREARAILIRDTNKEVARSVLQSPKLNTSEVEAFAAMRNVSDEVLQQISSNREWIQCYGIMHNLVKNPRTPPFISQRFLSRLRHRDLALLTRDRTVPDIVRRNAQIAFASRNAPKNPS